MELVSVHFFSLAIVCAELLTNVDTFAIIDYYIIVERESDQKSDLH